jgi:hypothetical protein
LKRWFLVFFSANLSLLTRYNLTGITFETPV